MFAVVKTGGKQYKVAQGDVIQVEKLAGEAGSKVQLVEVMLINDNGKAKIGTPFIAGAKIDAEIVGQERSRKVIVFKKKRRQNYRRKNTHRQDYTILRITGIAA
jgi:large subunit ribosomal protein L21